MGARRMMRAANLHGQQITSMYPGVANTTVNRNANTGPIPLLTAAQKAAYPAVNAGPGGPLTAPPLPSGGYWRLDGSSELDTGNNGLCTNWTSVSAPYTYNNLTTNLGGLAQNIGGTGGQVIDGFFVPAGTYVFQFMDFSLSNLDILGGFTGALFRGCRCRQNGAAPGSFNTGGGSTSALMFHFCDVGGLGPTSSEIQEVPIDIQNSGGIRIYRCYVSYVTTGLQPAASTTYIDLFENYIEKITHLSIGHLNGITCGGGQSAMRIQRNYIVTAEFDENGLQVNDTDCISMFVDFGLWTGRGTNPDGSNGYYLKDNYMGGTGYCVYLGGAQSTSITPYGAVANLNFTGNRITTAIYPTGGGNGPYTYPPLDGWVTGSPSLWLNYPFSRLSGPAPENANASTGHADLSVEFWVTQPGCTFGGYGWYVAPGDGTGGQVVGDGTGASTSWRLFSLTSTTGTTGTLVAGSSIAAGSYGALANTWTYVQVASPIALSTGTATTGTHYRAVMTYTGSGNGWSSTPGWFASGGQGATTAVNGPVSLPGTAEAFGGLQGANRVPNSGTGAMPVASSGGTNYWIDFMIYWSGQTYTNVQANNLWADGSTAGTAFI